MPPKDEEYKQGKKKFRIFLTTPAQLNDYVFPNSPAVHEVGKLLQDLLWNQGEEKDKTRGELNKYFQNVITKGTDEHADIAHYLLSRITLGLVRQEISVTYKSLRNIYLWY